MTGARDPAVDDLLAAAGRDFASRLPDRAGELESLVAREAWRETERAAHKLRGSAATYGFPEVGAVAAAIEDLLRESPGGGAPDAASRARIAALVAEARVECDRAAKQGAP
jgi:HPt (histidine-containing phosphotransfer) domain-containing protein